MHSAALLSATPQKLDFSSCSVNSPATELQSPQTHWVTSRHQSRLQPSDMTAANALSLSPLQRMSAAAVMHAVELSPQELWLTAVVMQRFCRWGEHRTIGDWPAELRAYGPLPAIHDALRASRTRSLTLPQLATAIKERTGGCGGGKALDMLERNKHKHYIGPAFGLLYNLMAQSTPTNPTSLLTVDASTMATNVLGATGTGAMFGLAYHSVNGLVYGFTEAGDIYTLDPTSGAATLGASTGIAFWGATTNPARWQ